MNSVKTCMKIGHKKSRAEHICTYIDCPLDRWCCTECLIDKIHSHGNNQSNYILHYTEFIKQIQAQSNPNLGKWQQLLQMVAELIELLQSFKNLIKDNLDKNNVNKNCIDLLYDNNQDQVLQLSSEDITNLLKYQPQSIKIYDSLEDSYAKINRRKQDIDMLFKNSIDIKEVQSKSLIKPWVKEIISDYKVIKLEAKTSYNLYAAQVSPCEKFVPFGGDDSKLRIHYLLSCRTIYMNLNDQIRTIEIQKDSKQIFIGGFHGNVILLKSSTDFQEQYKYKYQEKTIYQIIIISNSEILSSSSDETIIRFDYIQQQVMSRINFRSSWIDFDRNFARILLQID